MRSPGKIASQGSGRERGMGPIEEVSEAGNVTGAYNLRREVH
jgi:hypothetical protein